MKILRNKPLTKIENKSKMSVVEGKNRKYNVTEWSSCLWKGGDKNGI